MLRQHQRILQRERHLPPQNTPHAQTAHPAFRSNQVPPLAAPRAPPRVFPDQTDAGPQEHRPDSDRAVAQRSRRIRGSRSVRPVSEAVGSTGEALPVPQPDAAVLCERPEPPQQPSAARCLRKTKTRTSRT